MGRRNTPTLATSASCGENCGRYNGEVFRPPTSRRAAAVRVSTARASGKVRIPPIRGRAGELKVIGALIAAVAQGRGGVLVIEGPPGIGKSRLLTEVLALAEKAGVRALFGEAFEYQQTVPFFSLFMATLRADPPVGDAEALRRLGHVGRSPLLGGARSASRHTCGRVPNTLGDPPRGHPLGRQRHPARVAVAGRDAARCPGAVGTYRANRRRRTGRSRDADRAGTRGCQSFCG